ncbi:MAG: GNAT family N-acetyltransferase [Mycoplasma sp.]|nr:GNAT family N-acetyltransferase [Mycoplasma sp.]
MNIYIQVKKNPSFGNPKVDQESTHYGAFENNILIGVATLYKVPDEDSFIIYKVAVDKEIRGKGIGTFFMKEILKDVFDCEENKNCGIKLFARPGRESFYQRLGFNLEDGILERNGFSLREMSYKK